MTSTTELDSMTGVYDEAHTLDGHLMHTWYPQRVIAASRGDSLLDLGLGHGHTAAVFADYFPHYKVVEGSLAMIKRFRARFGLPQVEIVHGYFEDFDTEERFDHIGMGFVLEHVGDPAVILRRFKRFLKPGGSIFAAVPNCESLHRRIGHAAGLLPDMTVLSDVDRQFGHQRYYSLPTFTQLMQDEGLEVIKAEGILLKPVTTDQLMQLDLSPAILQGLMKVGVDYPELSNAILLHVRPRGGT